LKRAALDAAATFGTPAALDEDLGLTQPALGDAPIQSGAAVGSHAALHLMSCGTMLVFHRTEFAACETFVPAEASDYISRA
jgi:hypothetical protein